MKLLILVLGLTIASEVHYELEPVHMPDPPTPASHAPTGPAGPTYQQPHAYPSV